MVCITTGQLYRLSGATSFAHISSPGFVPHSLSFINNNNRLSSFRLAENSGLRNSMSVPNATSGISPVIEDDDGVSLGTMKLPPDTDIPRFETLLFQVSTINITQMQRPYNMDKFVKQFAKVFNLKG